MMHKWGVEDRVGMARERFKEFVERGNMCGGFVAIVKRIIVDEKVKAGLWWMQPPTAFLMECLSTSCCWRRDL